MRVGGVYELVRLGIHPHSTEFI